jgi:hypothetical protein
MLANMCRVKVRFEIIGAFEDPNRGDFDLKGW